ncbi:hypothetical protein EKD04_020560 [Chloroflexales bacterium ZM16-3]|nr:hypothetical protein [Chloroflexales bacterium ZM16-3]
MNRRKTRTISAVITAIILITIGAFVANRSRDTASSPQPTSAPAAEPVSVTTAAQPASITTAAQPASITTAAQPASITTAAQPATYPVSADQAGTVALASAPGAAISGTPALVSYQGAVVYEVTLDTGLVYVDATSGQVLANTATNATTNVTTSVGEGGEDGEDDEHDEGGEHDD